MSTSTSVIVNEVEEQIESDFHKMKKETGERSHVFSCNRQPTITLNNCLLYQVIQDLQQVDIRSMNIPLFHSMCISECSWQHSRFYISCLFCQLKGSLCTLKPEFFRVIEHHLPNFFQRAKRVRYKSSRRSLMEAINVVRFDWLIIFVH